jgi:4-hydroxy-4-methyl-2-oxoglutarate aldolase
MDQDHGTAASRARILNVEQLEAIRRFDTCTLANAIERFDVRLRNEGFTRPGLRCMTGQDERVLGYAATFRVRTSAPPVTGGRFDDRTDWWSEMEGLPYPAIAVFKDLDADTGTGACVGEVHAAILKAFGCCGVIVDGSVRDVPGIRNLGLPTFAATVAVSHSYMHIVDFGSSVEIFGLTVRQGDLLCADCHGVLAIPGEIAAQLPAVADRLRRTDQRIIEVCQAPGFSPAKLRQVIRENDQCNK